MLYGKVGERNFTGIVDGIARFCEVESTSTLGHRDAAVLRVCCDAQRKEIYDIDVSIYVGDRFNSGRALSVTPIDQFSTQTLVKMLGRRIGINAKESSRSRSLVIKHGDYIGFTSDNTVLVVSDKASSKLDLLIKLRLRDIYAVRLNNITERVANCLIDANAVIAERIDTKWSWTKKLICMAALECQMRATNVWEVDSIRDEYRNEAVIKLMLSELLFDGIAGLDEYNMYSNDAEQRVIDSELLVRCGKWLVEEGGQEVAYSLRAADLAERALLDWKKILEADLGVVLPALTKTGEMRKPRPHRNTVSLE